MEAASPCPVLPAMTRPPRRNSEATVNTTRAPSTAATREYKYAMSTQGLRPNAEPHDGGVATRNIPTPKAPSAGQRKFRFRLSVEVLRQASNGPMAVSSSSSNANGTATLLKKGGPTVILCPSTHSVRTGNNVPHSTVKQIRRKSQLLNKKLDSRETIDSSLCSLFR